MLFLANMLKTLHIRRKKTETIVESECGFMQTTNWNWTKFWSWKPSGAL